MKTTVQRIGGAMLVGALLGNVGIAADQGMVVSSATTQTSVTSTENSVRSANEMKWTELKGKVSHIDLQNKVVQIRESGSDTLLEIPVTDSVGIYKNDHHAYSLGDLKEGDKVTLRNNKA